MTLMFMSFVREKKLRKKDKKIHKTLTKMPNGVIIVSQNFEILFKNSTIENLLEDNEIDEYQFMEKLIITSEEQ